MEAPMFFAVLFAIIQMHSASRTAYLCAQGEFFSRDKMECVQCSDCPVNQVPLRICWKDQDTVCGPLTKFPHFQFGQPASQQPVIANADSKPEADVTHQLPVPHQTTVMVAEDVSGDRWFTITMVLVGILVFMCVLGVILIFVTCYVCKKSKREIICDPVFSNSLLKPDEQTGIRKIEEFRLVTET